MEEKLVAVVSSAGILGPLTFRHDLQVMRELSFPQPVLSFLRTEAFDSKVMAGRGRSGDML